MRIIINCILYSYLSCIKLFTDSSRCIDKDFSTKLPQKPRWTRNSGSYDSDRIPVANFQALTRGVVSPSVTFTTPCTRVHGRNVGVQMAGHEVARLGNLFKLRLDEIP